MGRRITIQVTCDTDEDAQDAIARLTRPRTWEDDVDARQRNAGPSEARIDQIMAGTGAAAPAPSGKDYSRVEADRTNVSPGSSTITKIGSETKKHILESLDVNVQPATRYAEHLKLLWSRGEIKFDGDRYYL